MYSRGNVFSRALPLLAVTVLLLAACSDSSPTEPTLPTVAGAWTGTFIFNDFEDCYSKEPVPAQATFEQDGSAVRGTLSAPTAPCFPLDSRAFTGTLQGNVLGGSIGSSGYVQGILTGSSLDIGLGINRYGNPSEGILHLHR